MKYFRCLVFSILSLANISFAAGIDDKIDFLITQKNFYDISLQLNQKHIDYYIKCLEDDRKSFSFNYFDKNGQVVTKFVSCQKIVPVIFDNRLQKEYKRMRAYLALSRTAKVAEAHIMSMSDNIDYKINRNIDHPNDTSLTLLPFDIARPEPLTDREVRSVMKIYHRKTKKLCQRYIHEGLDRALNDFSGIDKTTADKLKTSFCTKLDLKGYSSNTIYSLIPVLRNYHEWLERRRNEMRKEYLNRYYEVINKTPYFLLLEDESPSKVELIDALNIIKANSLDLIGKFNDYTQKSDINGRIVDYKNNVLSESEKNELLEDMTFYYNETLFLRVKSTVEDEMSLEAKAEVRQLVDKQDMVHTMKEIGIIFGGLAMCVAPIGKVLKLAKVTKYFQTAKVFKLGCFVALGLPLNSWFIYDAIKKYEADLVTMLASPEGRHLMQEYNSVSNRDIILNTLFVGFGIGAIKPFLNSVRVL